MHPSCHLKKFIHQSVQQDKFDIKPRCHHHFSPQLFTTTATTTAHWQIHCSSLMNSSLLIGESGAIHWRIRHFWLYNRHGTSFHGQVVHSSSSNDITIFAPVNHYCARSPPFLREFAEANALSILSICFQLNVVDYYRSFKNPLSPRTLTEGK